MTNTSKKAKIQAVKNSVQGVKTANELQVINQVAEQASEQGKQAKTDRQQAAQEKRDWLRAISADFQAQQKIMELTGAEYIPTINEMLRAYYEKQNNITELNTFDQWKEKGYQVKRGEKAYLFWGKPKRNQRQELTEDAQNAGVKIEDATEEQLTTITSAKDYFPVCYLFDISQCRPIQA